VREKNELGWRALEGVGNWTQDCWSEADILRRKWKRRGWLVENEDKERTLYASGARALRSADFTICARICQRYLPTGLHGRIRQRCIAAR